MYKFIFIACSAMLLSYVLARPQDQRAAGAGVTTTTTAATIVKQDNVNNADGSFNSSYETSNGIRVENIGYLKKIIIPKTETSDGQVIDEHEELVLVQTGSYSYSDPEGNIITLRYVADENGFQPEGDHLPVAPQ
ncbi:endocuticle structural glycoprotein SgAbd-3-like [Drosophila miranda]|uniref:Endocuticle structural glycoprotein SgAbd-3 n=1 Tax=Drosophila pseudoobscura pseudoobscura TaxID=46245 RepID=A0A6I8UTW6_DROPS|nr:endocuticle structural glycoprotein SgAbd-3 [Drosophila pseudoobscura]XP_033248198.1 endocuticle structural glycoprotein SgAbd-3-like [Drosophila miranda]